MSKVIIHNETSLSDKEGNKHIIGELKETRKQWQDVERLLNGESKDTLYIDWRKYGEYE